MQTNNLFISLKISLGTLFVSGPLLAAVPHCCAEEPATTDMLLLEEAEAPAVMHDEYLLLDSTVVSLAEAPPTEEPTADSATAPAETATAVVCDQCSRCTTLLEAVFPELHSATFGPESSIGDGTFDDAPESSHDAVLNSALQPE